MKTQIFKTFFVVFLMYFGASISAQTFVKPEQINTNSISAFLAEKNYETVEVTKEYLKIKKKGAERTFYLDLKNENRYIFFNIAYKLIDHVDQAKLTAYLNKANESSVIKVRHFEKGNDVQIEYYFWTKQGFSYETLLDAIEEFYLYIGDCIDDDTDKILQ